MTQEEEPQRLRILVADERATFLDPISDAIQALGHDVVAHETDIARVGQATVEHRPDVAIVAVHEDREHALELISEIVEEATCPVLALAEGASADFVSAAARRGVFGYLDSTQETELRGGIDIALQRYQQHRDLLQAFERRASIERAKGVLMERHGLGDREAFEWLRRDARASRRKVSDVAEALLGPGTA